MNICEYCEYSFIKRGNLYKHQRTAKYCLKLQGKEPVNTVTHQCTYCDKTFSRTDILNRHREKCTAREIREKMCGEQNKLLVIIAQLSKTIENLSQNRQVAESPSSDENVIN